MANIRRVFCSLLVILMIVAALPAAHAEGFISVASKEDLLAINNNPGASYRLTADIDLSGTVLTAPLIPLLSGTLDGRGHTISGLDITVAANEPVTVAMIGILTGKVQHLTVSGSININASTVKTGGIVAQSNGTLEDCTSLVSITCTANSSCTVGGAVGENRYNKKNGTILSCSNHGDLLVVSGTYVYLGGITASYGTIKECANTGDLTVENAASARAGGIIANEAAVKFAVNSGNLSINATVQAYAGGIAAFFGASTVIFVQNCENTGEITATIRNADNDDPSNTYAVAGGIAAYMANTAPLRAEVDESASTSTVRYCKNSGIVTAVTDENHMNYAGGIAGIVNGVINHCVNTANNNTGAVIRGPIFGAINPSGYLRGKVRDCYYSDADSEDGVLIGNVNTVAQTEALDAAALAAYADTLVMSQRCHHQLIKTAGVPPTCTTAGTADYYTCSVCGKIYADENAFDEIKTTVPTALPASGHDYEMTLIGKERVFTCRHCADSYSEPIEDVPDLAFAAASITLQNSIKVNYFVSKTLFTEAGYTDPFVTFLMNGQMTTVTRYTEYEQNDKCYYVFSFARLAPHKMNDVITAVLHADFNGVAFESTPRDYSIASYCYNMLGKTDSAKMKTLLVDLLRYGAASQVYTNYDAAHPADAALTAEQSAYGTADDPALTDITDAAYRTADAPEAVWKGASLNLNNAVTMQFVFSVPETDGVTVKIEDDSGQTLKEFTADDFETFGNYYLIKFKGLTAAQMSKAVYAAVYRDQQAISNTVRYSVESYAAAKQNGADANLAALVTAMMKYGNAAAAYVR